MAEFSYIAVTPFETHLDLPVPNSIQDKFKKVYQFLYDFNKQVKNPEEEMREQVKKFEQREKDASFTFPACVRDLMCFLNSGLHKKQSGKHKKQSSKHN